MTFSEIQLWFSNIQMRILKYNSGFQKLNWDFWNEIVIFRNWIEISEIQLWFSEIELRFLKYNCDFWYSNENSEIRLGSSEIHMEKA